jgi:hypothetical protein
MTTYPLIYVRVTTVYPVPPVCSAVWTAVDWAKQAKRIVEPLVLNSLGTTWIATGERDTRGHLLYRKG